MLCLDRIGKRDKRKVFRILYKLGGEGNSSMGFLNRILMPTFLVV